MGRVTLQDVAKAAGVSTATVSWAVNDNQKVRIPEVTRKKVRKVARELGYHPNALAKGLARGESSLIGFISDGVATTPFAGQVIRGAQDEAWRNGRILLIVDTGGKASIEHSAFEFMLEHQVEGIIYSTWTHRVIVPPSELRPSKSVLVNCFDKNHDFQAVVPDECQGGRAATQLLLDHGHKRIAFLNDPQPTPASCGRLEGYRDALEAAGIVFDPSLVINAQADQEGGYGSVDKLLATHATAAFCHNDRLAMGLYDALRERGLKVPEDISLVGFDNQEVVSAHLHPALSTVGLPQYELGVLGVRALIDLVDEGSNDGQPDGPLLVECPPVLRHSIVSA
ncbi:LacI family DNA-binding transcriptional regulator [Bifidobacterium sp. ESL0784]|uniref:LacI family DNA-binding transcriptional regulator n=1 Tax=Bifidobacterium sp. ESL0784 TaxID=2983231 RepID=UPI0023F8ADFE|nr:LacI family DNA-binding transcriptional regulator [Bifidobacterium sp. ESL0784]MDF7640794.1 LacI family DNA-binding transcriptional regulator [Bifidobacterium sp. ESL0784]